MNILSWNILAQEFIKTHYYPMIPARLLNQKRRQKQIMRVLQRLNPDIMLLQEVMENDYLLLLHLFRDTHYVLRGTNIKWQNKESQSANVILCNKTLFSLPELILFDFGVGAKCGYRRGQRGQRGRRGNLLILNIHLDDASLVKRQQQLKTLRPLLQEHEAVIVGGDFNDSHSFHLLNLKVLNRQATYYIESAMCIDNILTKGLAFKPAIVLNAFGTDVVKQFKTYGSDHLPVFTESEGFT